MWVQDPRGGWDLRDQQGALVGWVTPLAEWCAVGAVGLAGCTMAAGREANVEAAKAAVDAALWARAAEGLVGR